jgi:hypothetical protein
MDENAKPHKPEIPPWAPNPDSGYYDVDEDPYWNGVRGVLIYAIYNVFSDIWLLGHKKDS